MIRLLRLDHTARGIFSALHSLLSPITRGSTLDSFRAATTYRTFSSGWHNFSPSVGNLRLPRPDPPGAKEDPGNAKVTRCQLP
jgi:hypothetical protein